MSRFTAPARWQVFDLDSEGWTLESHGDLKFSVPVQLTNAQWGGTSSRVRGRVQGQLTVGESSFERLRFSLVNFPDYNGDSVHDVRRGGFSRSRLEAAAGNAICRVDAISEAADLRKRVQKESGFVISHVGEWTPESGRMTRAEADETLRMLHFWFGFLKGAWAGPVFPQGLIDGAVVWRQYAPWTLGESRHVTTWLPERKPADIRDLFAGFSRRWLEAAWQPALISAIAWLVEANSSNLGLEAKIVLAQVALELLAWVRLVETERLHSRRDFKRLSAAGKIRTLLQQSRIPAGLPAYLEELAKLRDEDAFDGPGVITKARNALVHAGEKWSTGSGSLSGLELLQCSSLALNYVELSILSLCGYSGHYARRGWRGWKGDDEVRVPWAD